MGKQVKASTHKWLGDPTQACGEPAPTTLVGTMVKTIVGHEQTHKVIKVTLKIHNHGSQ